jgi:hypothetical protein
MKNEAGAEKSFGSTTPVTCSEPLVNCSQVPGSKYRTYNYCWVPTSLVTPGHNLDVQLINGTEESVRYQQFLSGLAS